MDDVTRREVFKVAAAGAVLAAGATVGRADDKPLEPKPKVTGGAGGLLVQTYEIEGIRYDGKEYAGCKDFVAHFVGKVIDENFVVPSVAGFDVKYVAPGSVEKVGRVRVTAEVVQKFPKEGKAIIRCHGLMSDTDVNHPSVGKVTVVVMTTAAAGK